MPRFATLLCLALLLPAHALAQAPAAPAAATRVKGRIVDVTTRAGVPGVALKLTSMADTSEVHRTAAKDDGTFALSGLGVHSYRLEATRVGYSPLKQVVRVTQKDQDLGLIALTPESVPVSGITVTESPAPAVVRADTTEFRASAVKINKDANAEDLVQKMPGVTVENGQVKAQGETVQNVLVNGRPFFGNDPQAAMRNLPAEVVDRIQVYDRMSDQAEFSGFDDGSSQKTMNFILRDQKARFGKVYAGGGDSHYQAGGNLTQVRGANRLTLIGMSNDLNQQNFSPQDLFGAMSGNAGGGGGPRIMMMGGGMRPPGGHGGGMQVIRMGGGGGSGFDPGNFFVGQQPGLTTTHSGGVNYVGQWGKRLQVSSSFFANGMDNDNVQSLARTYQPPQDSIALYGQSTIGSTTSGNQRFDARFEWTPDSLNSVIFAPRLYFQGSDALTTGLAANTSLAGTAVSDATNRTTETIDGDNLSGRLTLRHRFGKRGRNVSADLNAGRNLRDRDGTQQSLTTWYLGTGASTDSLDQESDSRTRTTNYSARVAFTEPLTKQWQLQGIWNPALTLNHADSRTRDFDAASGEYDAVNLSLSNSYRNWTRQQTGGLAALRTSGPWRVLLNASYQNTRLHSEQTWPTWSLTERAFDDFVPSLQVTGNFANRRSLRLSWNTSTTLPSVGQLQNVVNNSNTLSLSAGNPALRPTYNNTVALRWSEADPMRSKSRFLFANVTRTAHPIANATYTATADTTIGGVALTRGQQLTIPENLDESWNANLFGVWSRPAKALKSIVNLNGGGSFTRTPTRLNGVINTGSTWSLRSGTVVSSNISPNLDFVVSYMGSYNLRRNTEATGNTGDYFSHVAAIRFNAVAPHGIVVRQELNHNYQNNSSSSVYGQDVLLWNTTLGKKFLKNDRAEVRVTATDVLERNRSVSRSITETYVQDQRDLALGRYVQAVLTYNFR